MTVTALFSNLIINTSHISSNNEVGGDFRFCHLTLKKENTNIVFGMV